MDHTLIIWYDAVTIIFSFFAGAAIGSGIMCFLMRRAQNRSWLKGRSTCDCCGHQLSWHDLVPILSYVFSNGKCRYCGANIPVSCISAELIYGLLGVVCAVTIIFPATPITMRLCFLLVALVATIIYTGLSNSIIKGKEAKHNG